MPVLPELPDVHLNYGNALRETGKLAEAVASYRRAIALNPDYGMAHNNLAAALNQQEEFAAGLASSERAIALIPEFFGAYVNRADALMGLERFAEAEGPLRRALDLAPDRAQTHRDLGWVLAKLGRYEEAVTCLEQAIALDPDDPTTHFALGTTLYLRKDLPGSEAALRRAVALAPRLHGGVARARHRVAQLRPLRRGTDVLPPQPSISIRIGRRLTAVSPLPGSNADEAQLRRLEAVLKNRERSVSDRISAGFALGTLLDNAERCDEAFPCFAEANALHRQQRAEAGERFDIERVATTGG